jgi:hypothetical protein
MTWDLGLGTQCEHALRAHLSRITQLSLCMGSHRQETKSLTGNQQRPPLMWCLSHPVTNYNEDACSEIKYKLHEDL